MAWWAVDRAAELGLSWARRDCMFAELAKYYLPQGFDLVREANFKGPRLFIRSVGQHPFQASTWRLSGPDTGVPRSRQRMACSPGSIIPSHDPMRHGIPNQTDISR
jgi:hypothetical protein